MHALLLRLIALSDGCAAAGSVARGNFLVLLDDSAADAPVTGAAIAASASFNVVTLSNFATLQH